MFLFTGRKAIQIQNKIRGRDIMMSLDDATIDESLTIVKKIL